VMLQGTRYGLYSDRAVVVFKVTLALLALLSHVCTSS